MRIELILKSRTLLLFCLVYGPLQAASFDCGKASTSIEKLVCDSPAISSLDDELNKVYRDVMAEANAQSRDYLQAEQRRWLTQTRNACHVAACLMQAYSSRQAEMQAFFVSGSPTHNREREKRELLNNTSPFVTVACDAGRDTLYISEGRADAEADIPQGEGVFSLNGMLKFVPIGAEDGRTEVKSTLEKKCQRAAATYMLVVVPHKYNHHVQGACGAASPSVKLTLFRDDKILIKDLLFKVNCWQEGGDDTEIETVSVSEAEHRVTFYIRQNGASTKRIVEFKKLPTLNRSSLFR